MGNKNDFYRGLARRQRGDRWGSHDRALELDFGRYIWAHWKAASLAYTAGLIWGFLGGGIVSFVVISLFKS